MHICKHARMHTLTHIHTHYIATHIELYIISILVIMQHILHYLVWNYVHMHNTFTFSSFS